MSHKGLSSSIGEMGVCSGCPRVLSPVCLFASVLLSGLLKRSPLEPLSSDTTWLRLNPTCPQCETEAFAVAWLFGTSCGPWGLLLQWQARLWPHWHSALSRVTE